MSPSFILRHFVLHELSMGNSVDCSCIIQGLASGDDRASRDRIEELQKGCKFLRKALMGLSSQEIYLRLSDDTSCIEWKVEATRILKEEHGEIVLSKGLKCVRLSGQQGLQFISNLENEKVIFEVQAEDSKTRDQWVLSINEMLQYWESNPDKRPVYNDSAASTSNKKDYFRKREEELSDRVKANEEKKKKYSTGGMKYTALAMMNRS